MFDTKDLRLSALAVCAAALGLFGFWGDCGGGGNGHDADSPRDCWALGERACRSADICAPIYVPGADGREFDHCEPLPHEGPMCRGLDERHCMATRGCEPVYGGTGCACAPCPVDEAGNVDPNCPPCDCPPNETFYDGCRPVEGDEPPPVPGPVCRDGSICADGTVCVNGGCGGEPGCTSNADCGDGLFCREGRCRPPLCTEDSQCDDGRICHEGRCVLPPPPPPTAACAQTSDCPEDHLCRDGHCLSCDGSVWTHVTTDSGEVRELCVGPNGHEMPADCCYLASH